MGGTTLGTGTGTGMGTGAGLGNTGGAGAMERNTSVVGSAGTTSGFSGTTSPPTSGLGAQRPGDPARPNVVPQGSNTASTVKPDDRSKGSTPPRGTNP